MKRKSAIKVRLSLHFLIRNYHDLLTLKSTKEVMNVKASLQARWYRGKRPCLQGAFLYFLGGKQT